LLVLDKDVPIAVIIGYERQSEENEQYPHNTLYIAEIATLSIYQHQGIGSRLLKFFLRYNRGLGLKYLKGALSFSVQTNAARWNEHVQHLYTSVGFIKRSIKTYPNRVDNIYGLE
jgi:ribosomal protein S18 acetylase RimI-like enzyme